MTIDRSLPWLVFPPAVDLANTIVRTARGPVDLLGTEFELRTWIAAERGRIPQVESARGRLSDVAELRDAVHDLLHHHAGGRALPPAAVARLNASSRDVPVAAVLGEDGAIREEPADVEPFRVFAATVARSAIELVGSDSVDLRICGAPSCGMLFVADRARQTWCSPTCGNRARVARHARRRRPDQASPRATG